MRGPEKLRVKWEKLKKSARKRSALIRQNNLKTGGGRSYIPPDEVLDRVASILGAKCNGLTADFGGDAGTNEAVASEATSEAVVAVLDFQPLPELAQGRVMVLGDNFVNNSGGGGGSYTPKNFLFNTPKSALNKRKKLSEELQRAQRDKDLGMAAYFQAKTRKINLENTKLELEIRLLKQKVDGNE